MNLENKPTETIGWQEGTDDLEVVLKHLPAIQNGCNAVDTRWNACRWDANIWQHPWNAHRFVDLKLLTSKISQMLLKIDPQ